VQQYDLDDQHDARLDEEEEVVSVTDPVENSVADVRTESRRGKPESDRRATYLVMDATSIISGMSSEKPADERFLLMDHIWSAYEVTGEVTMKIGAIWEMTHLMRNIVILHWHDQYTPPQFKMIPRPMPQTQGNGRSPIFLFASHFGSGVLILMVPPFLVSSMGSGTCRR
jgi:hypothetical protein